MLPQDALTGSGGLRGSVSVWNRAGAGMDPGHTGLRDRLAEQLTHGLSLCQCGINIPAWTDAR